MTEIRLDQRAAQLRQELATCRQRLQELQALEQRLVGALFILEELQRAPAVDTVGDDGGGMNHDAEF